MIPITVIPIILTIAVVPPVLAPDSDPVAFLNNIIPSIEVACAGGNFFDMCGIIGGPGQGYDCNDLGCSDIGGTCKVVSSTGLAATNTIDDLTCMCVFPAVGGWFLEVDNPTLLVAGAQHTAAWMIPAIVSAIGIGIVLARKF